MEQPRPLKNNPEQGVLNGLFYKNPVLVRMVGIGPVVAAAVTLKNGLALCIIMAILFLATGFFSFKFGPLLPDRARTPAYVITSALAVIPAFLICGGLLPGAVTSLGVFGPVMIVNTIIISRTGKYDRTFLNETASDIFGNILGFSAVVIVFSAIREIVSLGSVFDIPLENIKTVKAAALPFAGYIMLGFAAAFLRRLRIYVKEKQEGRWEDE